MVKELKDTKYNCRGAGIYDMLLPLDKEVKGWLLLINDSAWVSDRGQFLFETREKALSTFRSHAQHALISQLSVSKTGVQWPSHDEGMKLLHEWREEVNFRVIPTTIMIK